jgi:hypothetical protein
VNLACACATFTTDDKHILGPLFFTYTLLAVVYVSLWLRIDFLTSLVCNLSK